MAWNPVDHPALPDGTPESGDVQYTVQVSVNGSTFTDPVTAGAPSIDVPVRSTNDSIVVKVSAGDAVGNASAVSTSASLMANVEPYESADTTMAAAAAYAGEFGGPMSTAVEWMRTQTLAVGIEDDFNGVPARAGFVAAWDDNVNRRVKVDISANADRSKIAQILADRGLTASTDLVVVLATIPNIDDARDQVTSALADLIDSGALQLGRRASSDALVFTLFAGATSGEEARVRSQAATVSVPTVIECSASDSLLATATSCNDRVLADGKTTYGCDAPIRGGIRIEGRGVGGAPHLCTSGFVGTYNGQRVMLVAGHCTAGLGPNSTWTYASSALQFDDLSSQESAVLGTATGGGVFGPGGDYTYIKLDSALAPLA